MHVFKHARPQLSTTQQTAAPFPQALPGGASRTLGVHLFKVDSSGKALAGGPLNTGGNFESYQFDQGNLASQHLTSWSVPAQRQMWQFGRTASIELQTTPFAYGDWHGFKFCPNGTYASSMRTRVEPKQGGDDDTAMNAVAMRCSSSNFEIMPYGGLWGDWSDWQSCPNGEYFVGMRGRFEMPQGDGDDTTLNAVQLQCSRGSVVGTPNATPWGVWLGWMMCPEGTTGIIGFSIQFERSLGSGSDADDTAMNSLHALCGSW
jgi:hypothetical protein